jgi:hypothetical protein
MRYLALGVLLASNALALTEPPLTQPATTSARQEGGGDRSRAVARAEEILRIGASTAAADQAMIQRLLTGAVTPLERHAAIKAVRSHHAAIALAPLQTLIDDPDPSIALDATVALHRLRPSPKTLARLEGLRDRGAKLRAAFVAGEVHGRPTYTDAGLAFFRRSAVHPLLETRLDGALGLVELGGDPRKEGLVVLKQALGSPSPADRKRVVRMLNVQYDEPAFVTFLEQAKADPDEEVKSLAVNILATRR